MTNRMLFALILWVAISATTYSQVCGNNITQIGQTCDDQNTVGQDGCDENCQLECGNGVWDELQECEDGNRIPLDGCDENCQRQCGNGIRQGNQQCDDGNTVTNDLCDLFCRLNCGNSVRQGQQQCDDGNRFSGDGCSQLCTNQICGNGVLDFGQACDDGNLASSDGCTSDCRIQLGFTCPAPGSPCASTATCGNGVSNPGEQCDDGNTINTDSCSNACLNNICGNGRIDGSQACDDSNTTPNDGCSGTCTIQTGFTCLLPGTPCSAIVECGNNRIDTGEECDDGNQINGDGCSSACLLEACGNGVLQGAEECDDGNTADDDGCDRFCDLEPVCGNGIKEEGEECDDGNTVSSDGCFNCEVEGEAICNNGVCNPITSFCGNGISQFQFGEACDDGNTVNGDGCSSTCQVEANYICRNQFFPSICTLCGNGMFNPGEACDDSNFANGDGCSNTCQIEDNFECTSFPSTCSPIPIPIVCGNGLIQAGEQCDDGNTMDGDGCTSTCTIEVPLEDIAEQECIQKGNTTFTANQCVCKQSFTQMGEQCACTSAQFLNSSGLCERIPPPCGNGVHQPRLFEECDDSNNADGDGCSSGCSIESGFSCRTVGTTSSCFRVSGNNGGTGGGGGGSIAPPEPQPITNVCGNGQFQSANNEQCDDGNTVAFDGCSSTCNVETNFECSRVQGQTSTCTEIKCGNGVTESNFQETCDDRNRVDGDGCSSTCQIESGFFCFGQQCISNCGNGQVQAFFNEQCDDGSKIDGDGCSSTCQIEPNFSCTISPFGFSSCRPSCGDGARSGAQQCDDFNVGDGDGCSSNCIIEPGWTCTVNFFGRSICESETVAYCGNGAFEPENGQQCDDGNNINTDGCSNGCFLDPNFNCENVIDQRTRCSVVPDNQVICLDPQIFLGGRGLPGRVLNSLAGTSISATTYAGLVQEIVSIENGVGTINQLKFRQLQISLFRSNLRGQWAGLSTIITRCASG